MNKLFSLDSGLYKFMSRLFDMLKLNAMWLLCSIPIVTMGAATTAAYSVTLRMVDEEEGYIAGPFLKAFKENLLKGSVVGIINLFAFYALFLDFQFYRVAEEYNAAFLAIGIIGMVVVVTHLLYAYPLLARYENSIINTLRNSHSICLKYFLKTIFLVIVLLIEYVIFFQLSWTLLFFGIILGPACFILTISGFARQFFRNIERENEIRTEETKIARAEEQEALYTEKDEEE